MNLSMLRAMGFDNSRAVPFKSQHHVGCSQCAALVINNVPTHETGCPNAMHECRGCNALVPVRTKYCEECAL